MNNYQLAERFTNIADLLEIKGETVYKVRAYRRASEGIESYPVEASELLESGQLEEIPGVGKAIAEKIEELLETGELEFFNRLQDEVPVSLLEILQVEGVGPKKAARFWKELDVETLDELESAAQAGRVQELDGFGPKSEQKLITGIASYKQRDPSRHLISTANLEAQAILAKLHALEEVVKAEVGGSLRRAKETIGDLDIVVATEKSGAVRKAFLDFPEIKEVRSEGDTKLSVALSSGIRLQLWMHSPNKYGSALQYATGSQAHNVKLREMAIKKGLSLSEHGFSTDAGDEIRCPNEEEVYTTLGLPWIPPELREDQGEFAAAQEDDLPALVEEKDLRGELHVHSSWSDGKATIEKMAEAAIERGLEYLVITDHSRSLGVAGGLSIDDLKRQREEIDRVQETLGEDIKLFQGAEVEILSEGGLDYPDEVLAQLDFVIASLHMGLRQSRDEVTSRVLAAIDNPHVDLVGHLTGRLIGRRDPADFDLESIFARASKRGVILEINSNPERLDLKDIHVRRAVELGCLTAITTDAHRPEHIDFCKYGVGTARRGWVTASSVVNTWSQVKFEEWFSARG